MKSIRQRLFLQIGLVVLISLGLIALANIFFLERYYIAQQKKILVNNYDTLNTLASDTLTDAFDTYIDIESTSNVEIVLIDEENTLIYSTGNHFTNELFTKRIASLSDDSDIVPLGPRRSPKDVANKTPRMYPNQEFLRDRLFFSTGKDPISNGQTLALIGVLDNGYYVNIRTPLASIDGSIAVVNDFLMIIGIATLIIAMVITFIFSNFFTRPIKEISRVTGHMKALNFDEVCQVTSKDELGALALNVNEMSHVLSTTIDTLKDEIQEKNRLDHKRRQLLNNVSHELKTPLSLLEGYAEALQLGIHSDPKKIDFYCDVIMDESQKMNTLVQSLLNIDQLAFGDITTTPIEINLSQYLTSTLKKFQPQLEALAINLEIAITPNVLIFADTMHLEQLFTNYLTNAIHYCNEGKLITISLEVTLDKALVQVYNSSKKLSPEDRSKIWDSFYKIDTSRSRQKGGHGLGLSIVQAIQEADGLGYGVYNDDQGVVFWFEQNLIKKG